MPSPPTLLYLVKQVELTVRSELDDVTRPAGLTVLQYTALTVLERQADLTAAHLARRSFVTAQTMADMVTSLVERGWIERRRDPQDRRRLVLALTPAGRRLLTRLRPGVDAVESRMVGGLSQRRVAELRRSLEACRVALQTVTTADDATG